MTTWTEDAIGQEADDILNRAIHGNKPEEWARFLFGPKSLVGDDFRADHAFHRFRDTHPIELYLRELFDQAVFRCAWDDQLGVRLYGPLKKVTFSHPVTWTKDQRATFMRHLTSALERSAMSELLPAGGAANLVREEHALDEATSAFMGFVLERYSGLDGDDLVRMIQPFDPAPNDRIGYPKKAQILVFDCGEGTTDVVWLEVVDPGGNQAVESTALRHFAMDHAGLEVTRKLAELLKELLVQRNPSLKELLRTNLHEPGIDKRLLPQGDGHTVEAHRRRLTLLLFGLAEEAKIRLTSGATYRPWTNLATARNFVSGARVEIPSTAAIRPELLVKIVREVFAPAVDQLRGWFSENVPKLDMVLLSGRSCQLPELTKIILDAIPSEKQPYAIDFVDPRHIRLDDSGDGCPAGEKSKTVVCTGLILNHWNRERMHGKPIRCKPIDERRRTRAIGVMAGSMANVPLPHFSSDDLLVQPDNEPITPNKPLAPVRVTNPESSGFFVGINFGGKGARGRRVDPVRALCRMDIQGGVPGMFDELQFYFAQTSASQIRLRGIRLIKGAGHQDFQVSGRELASTVKAGPLTIRVKYDGFDLDNDFRTSGRIHDRLDA